MRNSVFNPSMESKVWVFRPASDLFFATSVVERGVDKAPDFSLGSSTSLIPSPTRLIAITIIKIITPGTTEV